MLLGHSGGHVGQLDAAVLGHRAGRAVKGHEVAIGGGRRAGHGAVNVVLDDGPVGIGGPFFGMILDAQDQVARFADLTGVGSAGFDHIQVAQLVAVGGQGLHRAARAHGAARPDAGGKRGLQGRDLRLDVAAVSRFDLIRRGGGEDEIFIRIPKVDLDGLSHDVSPDWFEVR